MGGGGSRGFVPAGFEVDDDYVDAIEPSADSKPHGKTKVNETCEIFKNSGGVNKTKKEEANDVKGQHMGQ